MSRTMLAAIIGVSEESVRGWLDESTTIGPSATNLIHVALALDIEPIELYDFEVAS